MTDFQQMITDVTKNVENGCLLDVICKIINTKFSRYYHGKEHDYILKQYANYLYVDLTEWFFANYHKNQKSNPNLDDMIKIAKEKTAKWRENIFYQWKNCSEPKNKFAILLQKLYNLEEEDIVKQELGI